MFVDSILDPMLDSCLRQMGRTNICHALRSLESSERAGWQWVKYSRQWFEVIENARKVKFRANRTTKWDHPCGQERWSQERDFRAGIRRNRAQLTDQCGKQEESGPREKRYKGSHTGLSNPFKNRRGHRAGRGEYHEIKKRNRSYNTPQFSHL